MTTTATTTLTSQFILATRTVKVGDLYSAVEVDMPYGTVLVVDGRPNAFLPKGKKGKTCVDGVYHHVKYGYTRGVGAMWLNEKGRTTKQHKRVCAAEVLTQAAKGGWGDIYDAARANGTFDAVKAELDAVYEAVSSIRA